MRHDEHQKLDEGLVGGSGDEEFNHLCVAIRYQYPVLFQSVLFCIIVHTVDGARMSCEHTHVTASIPM